MQTEKLSKDWVTVSMPGGANANSTNITDALDKGDADTAKVFEGTDQSGQPMTFVVIKNYRP